ncbi:hypothetical protein ACJ41O_002780 [Fusarium nematophilum]
MCGACNGDTAGNAPAAANPTTNDAPPSTSTNNSVYPAQGGPKSSPYQSIQDYISNVNRFKIIEHVEGRRAVECGVDGVDLVIGTSSFLRQYSHGKSMAMIQETALKVIEYVKSQGVEVRFSSEDSFRSDLVDILHLYKACDKAGVDRVGVADTVGGATPRMVYDLIRTLRGVLGIGERNGITPLGALMARMIVTAPDYVKSKYNLKSLKSLEELVADAVQINIPFNSPVTGYCAFTHKAGIHAKAILANPSTYEIIDPHDFGCRDALHLD